MKIALRDNDQYVLYRENGVIKGTPMYNYGTPIVNGHLIQTFTDFEDFEQAKHYLAKYGNISEDDIIIADSKIKDRKKVKDEFSIGEKVIYNTFDGPIKCTIKRKLSEEEKQANAYSFNPDAGDYYEVETESFPELGGSDKYIVWEGRLDRVNDSKKVKDNGDFKINIYKIDVYDDGYRDTTTLATGVASSWDDAKAYANNWVKANYDENKWYINSGLLGVEITNTLTNELMRYFPRNVRDKKKVKDDWQPKRYEVITYTLDDSLFEDERIEEQGDFDTYESAHAWAQQFTNDRYVDTGDLYYAWVCIWDRETDTCKTLSGDSKYCSEVFGGQVRCVDKKIKDAQPFSLVGCILEFVEGNHDNSMVEKLVSINEMNEWLKKEDVIAYNENPNGGYDKAYVDLVVTNGINKYRYHGGRVDLGDGTRYNDLSLVQVSQEDINYVLDLYNKAQEEGRLNEMKVYDKKSIKDSYNPNYKQYYEYLEDLRKSSVTNMFGAVPYLVKEFNLDKDEAKKILLDWMDNYNEIAKELHFYDKKPNSKKARK